MWWASFSTWLDGAKRCVTHSCNGRERVHETRQDPPFFGPLGLWIVNCSPGSATTTGRRSCAEHRQLAAARLHNRAMCAGAVHSTPFRATVTNQATPPANSCRIFAPWTTFYNSRAGTKNARRACSRAWGRSRTRPPRSSLTSRAVAVTTMSFDELREQLSTSLQVNTCLLTDSHFCSNTASGCTTTVAGSSIEIETLLLPEGERRHLDPTGRVRQLRRRTWH